jgi:hypothetical protein
MVNFVITLIYSLCSVQYIWILHIFLCNKCFTFIYLRYCFLYCCFLLGLLDLFVKVYMLSIKVLLTLNVDIIYTLWGRLSIIHGKMHTRRAWRYQGVIRSCKSKKNYIQYNGQKEEGQTTIYKALHRKHEPH